MGVVTTMQEEEEVAELNESVSVVSKLSQVAQRSVVDGNETDGTSTSKSGRSNANSMDSGSSVATCNRTQSLAARNVDTQLKSWGGGKLSWTICLQWYYML